jgi:hypothetical protein
MLMVLPLAVIFMVTLFTQPGLPTVPEVVSDDPLLPAFIVKETDPPQVDVPFQVPTNFAASLPLSLFLVHDDNVREARINTATTAVAALPVKLVLELCIIMLILKFSTNVYLL